MGRRTHEMPNKLYFISHLTVFLTVFLSFVDLNRIWHVNGSYSYNLCIVSWGVGKLTIVLLLLLFIK